MKTTETKKKKLKSANNIPVISQEAKISEDAQMSSKDEKVADEEKETTKKQKVLKKTSSLQKKKTIKKLGTGQKKLAVGVKILKNESDKTKGRKNELDMLEGVIVSRRLGRNCNKEGSAQTNKKLPAKLPITRERRTSTQSNSSVKSQRSVTGSGVIPKQSDTIKAKNEISKGKRTDDVGELKSSKKLMKKKVETEGKMEDGEPIIKQQKLEKASLKNNSKRMLGKAKKEDQNHPSADKPLKLNKKLKTKEEGKSTGDPKKKKIRKDAGRRTRMTGSNTRSTNIQL